MSYYTYKEEIRDEEVPEEVIVKKHRLPQLPDEVISMILFKFGVWQSPIARMIGVMREHALISKDWSDFIERVEDKVIKLKKRRDDLWHDGWVTPDVLPAPSEVLTERFYRGVKMIKERCRGETRPCAEDYEDKEDVERYHNYTYNDEYFWKKSSIGQGVYDLTKPVNRQLVSKRMKAKELKELLDMNKIKYPKSAQKKKLLEKWYKN